MTSDVRPAEVGDIATLISLSRRTINACYRGFLGDAAVNAFIESGAADSYVRDNIAKCWVVVTDTGVAGFAVCVGPTIDLMMIDVTRHRQGLGSDLLGWIESMLFGAFDELRLESFAANDNANRFYTSHQWRRVDRYVDTETGIDRIALTKARPIRG